MLPIRRCRYFQLIKRMKVLLTGATGQVGLEIIKTQPESVEIIQPNRNQLNLSDYDSCKKIVEK